MDKIDKQILELLQENARIPLKNIAEKVSLSSPAISSRIDHLEKSGIIQNYHIDVDREKLGYHITAFINLEMQPTQKKEFYPFVRNEPNVLECNCVTGEYSMLLKVTFPNTVDLDDFIGRLQKFGRTSTQIVFSTPVEPRSIPIPDNI
ncbi:MAG: Lrp/AsnC family transcriptional regulator [Firmicutes bacterium]|nr:Lrp/AsnC family transcriptional regulator [Bacillota bacterium]